MKVLSTANFIEEEETAITFYLPFTFIWDYLCNFSCQSLRSLNKNAVIQQRLCYTYIANYCSIKVGHVGRSYCPEQRFIKEINHFPFINVFPECFRIPWLS